MLLFPLLHALARSDGGPYTGVPVPITEGRADVSGDTTPSGPSPSPSAPSTCPIPITSTGTQLDLVLAEVASICEKLSGATGSEAAQQGSAALFGIPGIATGGSSPAWISADVLGDTSTVVLGLLQGTEVPGWLEDCVVRLRASGAAVDLVLVPDLSSGARTSFGSWAARTLEAIADVSAVAVGIGAPPEVSEIAQVATDASTGVAAIRQAARSDVDVGLWWADGGLSAADQILWHAITAPSALAQPQADGLGFVAATEARCGVASSFEAVEQQFLGHTAPPVLVELVGVAGSEAGACAPGEPSNARVGVIRRLGAGPLSAPTSTGG